MGSVNRKTKNYILEGKNPVPCNSSERWAVWFASADRIVAKTIQEGVTVSTVFIGLDCGIDPEKPELFETMVFGGDNDDFLARYSTWQEAEKGHQEVCKLVFPN